MGPIGRGGAGFVSISPLVRDPRPKPRRGNLSTLPFLLVQPSLAVREPPDQPVEKDSGRQPRGSRHLQHRLGRRGGTGTRGRAGHSRRRPFHGRHDGQSVRAPAVRARLPGGLESIRHRSVPGQPLFERPQSIPAGVPGPGGPQRRGRRRPLRRGRRQRRPLHRHDSPAGDAGSAARAAARSTRRSQSRAAGSPPATVRWG